MNTIVVVSDEVQENIDLSTSHPERYYLANVGLVDCQGGCAHALAVFLKDVDYTKWTCSFC